MSRKNETERQKQIQEKCQTMLTKMLRDDDNKYCVDCDAKGPRWASWNLGVFLCIRCAGIHRNLGVHISRVKSVNLDSWTPEQVVSLEQMGNSRARAVYEALLPDGFRRPQTDSALESFIRAKYEHKKYLAREWVPPPPPKVDWDKEIDEEIERQKRKKKAATSSSIMSSQGASLAIGSPAGGDSVKKTTSASVPLPKLKAPASSTKSSNRSSATSSTVGGQDLSVTQTSGQQPGSSDLLGLSLGGADSISTTNGGGDTSLDILSSSGGTNGTSRSGSDGKDSGISDLAKEVADLFNQTPSQASEAQAKLTKDKIMALYGSAPPTAVCPPGTMVSNSFNAFGSVGATPFVGAYHHHHPAAVPASAAAAGGFGAFQAFPPVVNGTVASSYMASGHPIGTTGGAPMMYNNGMAAGFPVAATGAAVFPNPLLGAGNQPPVMGGVGGASFVYGPPSGAGGGGGAPVMANFASFPPQLHQQQQPQQIPPSASSATATGGLSNQFGNMNLRDVWQ